MPVRGSLLRATRDQLQHNKEAERQEHESTSLSLCPVSRLRHGPPDVGSSFGGTGIAGEVVVFEGTFDPVFAHAVAIGGDTEGDIRCCGPVMVLAGGAEAFKRQVQEPRAPPGRKSSLEASCLTILLPCLLRSALWSSSCAYVVLNISAFMLRSQLCCVAAARVCLHWAF